MGTYYKRKNIKWLKCQYCKSFHPAKTKVNPSDSTCKQCEKEWIELRAGNKHIHLQQRVFWHNCEICNKLFSSGGHNTQNCSDCSKNLNEFRKVYGLSHFVKKIKYIPCEVCNANHAIHSRHNSQSLCWVCRKIMQVSIVTLNCVDCGDLICTDKKLLQTTRCKPCQQEYKKNRDREYQKQKRNDPASKQIMAERNKKNLARIRFKKWIGKSSPIKYNECASCQKHFIYRGRTEEYLCNDCNDEYKTVSITYKKCIDCKQLSSMKSHRTGSWKRCDKCRKVSEKNKRKDYNKKSGYKNHRQRAKSYGVYYEPVNKSKVFKRDKDICQVCGCKCNKINNHPKQATLGHIIPLSRGGPHTYTNVRTECRYCNIKRATSCDNEQISLFALDNMLA